MTTDTFRKPPGKCRIDEETPMVDAESERYHDRGFVPGLHISQVEPCTIEIQRLDYSKPPPGYEINSQWFNDGDSPDAAGVGGCLPNEYWQQWQWVLESEDDCGDWFGEGDEEDKTDGPVAALADAWADYKAHNDPPGMTVVHNGWYVDGRPSALAQVKSNMVLARAAAWAWYDRRLALFALSDAAEGLRGTATASTAWPCCLTWSDAQVTEVERWLVDSTMDLPEVLGGSAPGTYSPIETSAAADDGPHVCTGCIGDGPCVALEAEIEAEDSDANEIAELEAEVDDEDEFMDDGLCSPTPQSELPSNAEGPLSRLRWAMSLSWDDLLRQHRDRSPLVAKAVELAALRNAYNVICEALETEEAIEAEIRRRLACDEVPTELETRIAQWRADNPPPTPEQMASIKADIRDLARRRKARLLAERDQQSEPNPTGRDWSRQVGEHNATMLPLLDFSATPPGYEVDCYPHEKASDPPTSG